MLFFREIFIVSEGLSELIVDRVHDKMLWDCADTAAAAPETAAERKEYKAVIYTTKTKAAMKICFEAHKGQTDKSGMPYVLHPLHLAEQMTDEVSTVVALLHDVSEDTDITIEELSSYGFGKNITVPLDLLTRRSDVPYFEYIEKIKNNPVARAVKLADLAHNSDLSRLEEVSEKDRERQQKYLRAIEILTE